MTADAAPSATSDAGLPAGADYLVPIAGFTSYTTAQGAGKLVFVSGITARGADGEVRAPGDVAGQTEQVLQTITALLADAGGTLADVRQIRTYVTDIDGWPQIEQVWRRHWPDRFPASTLVQVSRLFDPAQLIETDAVAFIAGPAERGPQPGTTAAPGGPAVTSDYRQRSASEESS